MFEFFKAIGTAIETFYLEHQIAIQISLMAAQGIQAHRTNKKLKKGQEILLTKYGTGDGIPVIYGTRRAAGTVVFMETVNQKELFVVYAIAVGEVDDIDDLRIDGRSINDTSVYRQGYTLRKEGNYFGGTVASENTADIGNVLGGAGGDNPRMVFNIHHGSSSQEADPMLFHVFDGSATSRPNSWTADHKLSGIAYIAANFEYDTQGMFTGIPNLTARVKGKKVLDTRTSTTGYSSNPAMCLRDYLTNDEYGKGLATSALDDTSFNTAANDCDSGVQTISHTSVPVLSASTVTDRVKLQNESDFHKIKTGTTIAFASGGTTYFSGRVLDKDSTIFREDGDTATSYAQHYYLLMDEGAVTTAITSTTSGTITETQPRFECHAVIDTDETVLENTKDLIANMRGIFTYTNGTYSLDVEGTESSVVSLDEDDILESGLELALENKEQKYNKVEVEFYNSSKKYEADTVVVTDGLSDDGNEVLEHRAQFPFVTNQRVAYNHAEAILNRSRNNRSVTFVATPKVLKARVGEVITITSSDLNLSTEPYRITQMNIMPDLNIQVSAVEYQASVYGWQDPPAEDIGSNPTPPDPFRVVKPTSLAYVAKNTTTGEPAKLTWSDSVEYPSFEFRVQILSDSNSKTRFDKRVKATEIYLDGINIDTGFFAKVSAINSLGTESDPVELTFAVTTAPITTVDIGQGSIGGFSFDATKMYHGTGTFNNTNTAVYFDNTGQFSLKDKLSWNGTTLNISGNLTVENTINANKIVLDGINLDDLITATTQSGSIYLTEFTGIKIATAGGTSGYPPLLKLQDDQGTNTFTDITQTTQLNIRARNNTAKGAIVFQGVDSGGTPVNYGGFDADGNFEIGSTNVISSARHLHNIVNVTTSGQTILGSGNTNAQTSDKLYIGGSDLDGADAAIYFGNRGNGAGYGWRFFYEGSGSGNLNKLIIRSENLGSPVDALEFTQDGNATFAGDIDLADSKKIKLGASDDLQIYHDGSHSYVKDNGTGNLTLAGTNLYLTTTNGQILFKGLTDAETALYYDNSEKLATTSSGVAITGSATISGDLTVSGTTTTIDTTNLDVKDKNITLNYGAGDTSSNADGAGITIQDAVNSTTDASLTWNATDDNFEISHGLDFGDNSSARFGAGNDLEIKHTGNHSYITDSGTGNLYIRADSLDLRRYANGEQYLTGDANGAVTLFYNGVAKIATTSTGIDVTGLLGVTSDSSSFIRNSTDNDLKFTFTTNAGADFAQLVMDGKDGGSEKFLIAYGSTHGSTPNMLALKSNDSSAGAIGFFTNSAERGRFDVNGRLGLGTTSPDTNLDITSADVAGLILNQDTTNSAVSSRLFFKDSTRINTILNVNGSLDFRTGATIGASSGTSRMSIDGSGHLDLKTGDYKVNGTSVIDSSRNLLNLESILMPDTKRIKLGTSSDFAIYHTGYDSYLDNATGHLVIRNQANNADIVLQSDDGSGGLADYLRIDGSNEIVAFSKDIRFSDSVKAKFGTDEDLQIYHDGSNSRIHDNGTGGLILSSSQFIVKNSAQNENMMVGTEDGAVQLYHNNVVKLATTSSGITVTGAIAETTLGTILDTSGNLTNINNVYASGYRIGSTQIVDSSRNLTNIGTYSGGGNLSTSGRITASGSRFQSTTTDNSHREYVITTGSGGGDFFLGQIEYNDAADGAITGCIYFAYDYGTSTESPKIHFSFAQRNGTARGSWWYEHDDDAAGSNNVKAVLIDDGSGGMFVWVRVGDYARIAVVAETRHGGNWTGSGSLTAGTITTGTTLFDTSNDPTSEHHIGKLFAHGDSEIEGQLTIGSGNNLVNAGNMTIDVAGDLTLDADGGDIIFKDGGSEKGRFGSSGFSVVGNTAISGNFNTSAGGYQIGGTTVIDSSRNLTNLESISLADSKKIKFGDGTDLQIYHDGTDSYVTDAGTGNLNIKSNGTFINFLDGSNNLMAYMIPGGGLGLYHNTSKKFETTSYGVAVSGAIEADNHLVSITSGVGVGGTPADANSGELGAGFLNLARDDTADAKQITFGKNGAVHSYIETGTAGLTIASSVSDDDIIFKGNDGGSTIQALHLDMSAQGKATFNSDLVVPDAFVQNLYITSSGVSSVNRIDNNGNDLYFTFGGTSNKALEIQNTNGNVKVTSGDLQMGTTTVIDASRNLIPNEIFLPQKITHYGDNDTHIQFPSDDTFQVTTGNSMRLQVNNSAVTVLAQPLIITQPNSAEMQFKQTTSSTTASKGSIQWFDSGSNSCGTINLKANGAENNSGVMEFYVTAESDELGDDPFGINKMMSITESGVQVHGSLSKSSGSFKIDHPLKPDTHHLVHSFVESPQADNIYSGVINLQNGRAIIDLDDEFNMIPGTFLALNRELRAFVNNEDTWDMVRAKVMGSQLIIDCQNHESKAQVSWMVIGERQDKEIHQSTLTNEHGKIVVEPLKNNI